MDYADGTFRALTRGSSSSLGSFKQKEMWSYLLVPFEKTLSTQGWLPMYLRPARWMVNCDVEVPADYRR